MTNNKLNLFFLILIFTALFAILMLKELFVLDDIEFKLENNLLSKNNFKDNDLDPIDLVYTWVNGSDPKLIEEILFYKKGIKFDDDKCSKLLKTPFVLIIPKIDKLNIPNDLFKSVSFHIDKNDNSSLFFLHNSNIKGIIKLIKSKHEKHLIKPIYFKKRDCKKNKSFKKLYLNNIIKVENNFNLNYNKTEFYLNLKKLLPSIDFFINFNLKLQNIDIIGFNSQFNKTILRRKYSTPTSSFGSFEFYFDFKENNDYLEQKNLNDASGINRFEDKNELKYSLRSVEKYANWVKNIYIVTNGQVPNWLNLSNSRIKIITHEQIFKNKSHLPTFNSAAIEFNIHRIKGLSKKFLYLNDDFLFGSPVFYEDFYSRSKGFQIRLGWNVPYCSPSCPNAWLKDGTCDQPCNTLYCLYDGGDCLDTKQETNHSSTLTIKDLVSHTTSKNTQECSKDCPTSWLADEYCDLNCNNLECGFDLGDCKLNNTENFYFQYFDKSDALNTQVSFDANFYSNQNFNHNNSIAEIYTNQSYTREMKTNETTNFNKILEKNQTLKHISNDETLNRTFNFDLDIDKKIIPALNFSEYLKKYKEKNKFFNVDIFSIDYNFISKIVYHRLKNSLYFLIDYNLIENNLRGLKSKSFNFTLKTKLTYLYKHLEDLEININFNFKKNSFKVGRKLLDIYADSLVYSNYAINKKFDFYSRKVPLHMPILLDKDIIERMNIEFNEEIQNTSSHRFRQSKDLQFAFTFTYFLISENNNKTLEEKLSIYDTNFDKLINKNEMRTLYLKQINQSFQTDINFEEFWKLILNCTSKNNLLNDYKFTFNQLSNCEVFKKNFFESKKMNKRNLYTAIKNKDVSFVQINDDLDKTQKDLDLLRKDFKQFICINDNFSYQNSTLIETQKKVLNDFYESFLPIKSQFENNYLLIENIEEETTTYTKKYSKQNLIHTNSLLLFILISFFILIFSRFFYNKKKHYVHIV